jgi:hypothetical protein
LALIPFASFTYTRRAEEVRLLLKAPGMSMLLQNPTRIPQGLQWVAIGTWEGDAKIRAEPFDAIELALAELWADIGPREL